MKITHWYTVPPWRDDTVPSSLRPWLTANHSLTQRLARVSGSAVQVKVITQAWQRPFLDEAKALHIPYDRYARIRQVYLYCQTQPWIFARTVIPATTLQGTQGWLARLGSQPLGDILFSHAGLTRSPLQVSRLTKESALYPLANMALEAEATTSPLWARRSIFHLLQRPLLVTEVFLPRFFSHQVPMADDYR